MPLPRVVAPGLPHHITQRGNRRQRTFFCQEDFEFYIRVMADECQKNGIEVWSYCLMPNHVHMIAVPGSEEQLSSAIGEAHRLYSRRINKREKWKGHLWQDRYSSFVLGERHLLAAARYIELNPVKAEITQSPEEYPWSSARAHLEGKGDVLVKTPRMLEFVSDWRTFLESGINEQESKTIEQHERSGLPLADPDFVTRLESELGRSLTPSKRGRPRKQSEPLT